MLINRDPANSYAANVAVSGFTPASASTDYFYGETSGGGGISSAASAAGTTFTRTVPPYSLTTVVMQPNAAAAPTISGFSPGSGSIGSTVAIKGTGFAAPMSVIFGGNVAAVHGFNATQINAQVPKGASSGPIKVTTSAGSVSTASSFTVTSPPTITSFTPASGSAGTTVVIRGTNFQAPMSVIFAGNKAAVHGFNATQINADVPAGALSGPIRVNTSYGSASTASGFTVTP